MEKNKITGDDIMKLNIQLFGSRGASSSKGETYSQYVNRVSSSKVYQEANNQNRTFAKLANGLDSKTINQLQRFRENGTTLLSSAPKGWKKIEGAQTAPKGFTWYSNGKSRFGGEYRNALVKD